MNKEIFFYAQTSTNGTKHESIPTFKHLYNNTTFIISFLNISIILFAKESNLCKKYRNVTLSRLSLS